MPPPKYHRLSPGQEVRLRWGFIIRCEEVVQGRRPDEVVELRCTYDPTTRSGERGAARKVKGTIHWVSAAHAVPAEVRLYDRLFTNELPDDAPGGEGLALEPQPRLAPREVRPSSSRRSQPAPAGAFFQFERLGYFSVDPDSRPGRPVFNRSVGLRDTLGEDREEGARGVTARR